MFLDLSHALTHGVPTYPGLPAPEMSHYISYDESLSEIAEGREFAVDLITFVGGSSTYIDAPRHMDRTAGDIASLAIERLIDLPIVIVNAPPNRRCFEPDDFAGVDVNGKAVLLETGWDRHWRKPEYATGSPYLGEDAAHYLVSQGASLVGIDAVLIDDIDDPEPRPRRGAHAGLLGAGIPIIENLRGLDKLPRKGTFLTAVPAAVCGVGSFPVRAFARILR